MIKKFTEKETEEYYDQEDSVYRSFWDRRGILHWGIYYPDTTGHQVAMDNLTTIMERCSNLKSSGRLLDIGCGNGIVAIQMAKKYNCGVVGLDLSGVRVGNAVENLEQYPTLKKKVRFVKHSAVRLPFKDDCFSHVWSQATIYHVHSKISALLEIFRVLKKGGIFVFDDLTKPKQDISRETQKYVYERLLFDTQFSCVTYQQELSRIGFKIIEAIDISEHLRKTYEDLIEVLKIKLKGSVYIERYKYLIRAYQQTVLAVTNGEVGWGFFVCRKV